MEDQVVCLQKNKSQLNFLTLKDLKEYKKSSNNKLHYMQLYRNSIQEFKPYIYSIEAKFSNLSHSNYYKTKVKKGSNENECFNKEDNKYKIKIEKILKTIVSLIKTEPGKRIENIKADFVISNNDEIWLSSFDKIVFEDVAKTFVKIINQNKHTIGNTVSLINGLIFDKAKDQSKIFIIPNIVSKTIHNKTFEFTKYHKAIKKVNATHNEYGNFYIIHRKQI